MTSTKTHRKTSSSEVVTPELEREFVLHTGDALTWLRRLPSERADLILTDPPYESLEKHRARGTTTRLGGAASRAAPDGGTTTTTRLGGAAGRQGDTLGRQGAASLPRTPRTHNNVWFKIIPNEAFPSLFAEFYRVLAKDSHLYFFCDSETMFVVKPMAEAAGFRFWKPLVWDKVQIGMGYHYRCRYEFILFFEKGKRSLNDFSVPDVLEHARVRGGYPTEKPVELARTLIEQSTSRGELVLDPFAGSGAFGEAALRAGRRFAGCDLNSSATLLQRARLKELGREVR